MGPWGQLRHRLELEQQISDVAYCDSLMNAIEFALKYTAACLIALLPNDDSGSGDRYRWEYALFRSSGIGKWVDAVQSLSAGRQYPALSNEVAAIGFPTAVEQLTVRVSDKDWQYEVVREVESARTIAGCPVSSTKSSRPNLLEGFRGYVELRNKLDAHGAPTSATKSSVAENLTRVVEIFDGNLSLLEVPIVACRQSVLAGKSNVVALNFELGEDKRSQLADRHSRDRLGNGLFVNGRELKRISLITPSNDASDFYVANGNVLMKDRTAEALDYSSGQRIRIEIKDWITLPDRVARSETAALDALVPRGKAYTNAPTLPDDYIERPELQSELAKTLQDSRRLVITLRGEGGIGKTSLALRSVEEASTKGWFELILWFSARDIDLQDAKAIDVEPDVVTIEDLAESAAGALREIGTFLDPNPKLEPRDWLAKVLGDPQSGRILWVLDNFETLEDPLEVYHYFDEYVHDPHKVLITTRHRRFLHDYPISVPGMKREEFLELAQKQCDRLGFSLGEAEIDELLKDSGGHPYIAKIMLGEIKANRRSKPKKALGKREDILEALFERSFSELSRGARHIFLLLATWRSLVPIPVLEVVVNGSDQGTQVDIEEAVDELESLSLIQIVSSGDEDWLDIPTPAWLFGRKKLKTDPERLDVERESQLLQMFGPTNTIENALGLPRLVKGFWNCVHKQADDKDWLEKWGPWFDRLGRKIPDLWIWIADELKDRDRQGEAETFLRRAVEADSTNPDLWLRLAQHYESRGDDKAALQSWVKRALVPEARFADVSFAANKINGWLYRQRVELDSDQRRLLAQPLIDTMEARSREADGQDFSRLAWLYVNIGDTDRGVGAAKRGLEIDPDQTDCLRFVSKKDKPRASG